MRDDTATKNVALVPPSQRAGLVGGHLRQFWRDRPGFLAKQAALGDVTYLRIGPQPVFFLNHPDLIRITGKEVNPIC